MVNLHTERKVQVNGWLIKARWYYGFGVFMIGVLSKFLSRSNVNFPLWLMLLLLALFYCINFIFYTGFRHVEKSGGEKFVNILSTTQLTVELLMLVTIMHYAGGISSVTLVFFFMPIVTSSFLFGFTGSIIVAFFSALLVNGLVVLEYFNYISHVYRYSVPTIEFSDLSIALTKSLSTSMFYVIVAFYSGFGSRLLFHREELLEERSIQLRQKTKMLVGREHKLSEINSRLKEETNKISSIISNFTDPIIFIDSRGSINLFNPAAEEILGFNDSTIGKKVSRHNSFSMENFRAIIDAEYTIKIIKEKEDGKNEIKEIEEITVDRKDQKRVYKVKTASVCDSKELCYGYIKVFYDLTREKEIDRLKSEFISIAAHQLRTPLSAIKWAIKMVLDGDAGKLNPEQVEFLGKGYQSNERIIALVNDMLNVSRIEEGRFGYEFEEADFMPPFNEVLESLSSVIQRKNIKLKIEKPNSIPQVKFDRDKIILVLQNLLENAVKYTPEHGRIEINIKKLKKYLQISIKDNGVGIPEEDQEKLFSKFFRAKNVIRMQTDGSGLGLFIVKNIIEKHGGEIVCKSQEGKGTEFIFTLPTS